MMVVMDLMDEATFGPFNDQQEAVDFCVYRYPEIAAAYRAEMSDEEFEELLEKYDLSIMEVTKPADGWNLA